MSGAPVISLVLLIVPIVVLFIFIVPALVLFPIIVVLPILFFLPFVPPSDGQASQLFRLKTNGAKEAIDVGPEKWRGHGTPFREMVAKEWSATVSRFWGEEKYCEKPAPQ